MIKYLAEPNSCDSGKSSLLLALTRILDLSSGSIRIDGLDTSTLPREEVRSRLISITQDYFAIPGTIRQNIDPFDTASDEVITAILSKLGMWDAIQQKGGLHVAMTEEMLSSGQRQLFCVARALLRKDCGHVVLLDEATSRWVAPSHSEKRIEEEDDNDERKMSLLTNVNSVDHETESRVNDIIRNEFKLYTIIAIVHKLDLITDFDRVIVLDKGMIVEQGNPKELLRCPGSFKALWDAAHGHVGSRDAGDL